MENNALNVDVCQEPKIFAVAKLIKALDPSVQITKMQKLLYYVQGWSLAWTGGPMFEESPEAYVNGPVYPKVREDLKYSNSQHISRANVEELTSEQVEIICAVVDANRSLYAADLVTKTHQETPWLKARGTLPPNAGSNNSISHEDMLRYFLSVEGEDVPKRASGVGESVREPSGDFFDRESNRWSDLLTRLSA